MDGRLLFWSRWLQAGSLLVLVIGLAFVLAAGPVQELFESLYFVPVTGETLSQEAAAYAAFLQGVLGAVMVGWSVLLFYVARGPFRRGEPEAWRMLLASLAAWFVADTLFSLWTGYWQNAILNAGLAIVFVIPLAATYRRFRDDADG
jgi:hypothetical protein